MTHMKLNVILLAAFIAILVGCILIGADMRDDSFTKNISSEKAKT